MKNFIPKHLMVGILALMMTAAMPMAAFAGNIDTSGGTGSATVNLDVEAPTFSVTVPTALPINVSADGDVTTSSDVKIVNNSHGPVIVTNVALTGKNDWTVVEAGKDMSGVKVNAKEFGMTINGDKTNAEGNLVFSQDNWAAIGAKDDAGNTDELAITYDAVVAPQADTVNTDIAEVVFTIGWDLAEPFTLTDYYTFTDDPETGGWKVGLNEDFEYALYSLRMMGQPMGQKQYQAWIPGSPLPALPAKYENKPVTNISSMFALTKVEHADDGSIIETPYHGVSFGNLDLSDFDVSNVVNMEAAFYDCKSDIIDLSSFDFSKIDVPDLFIRGVKTVYVKNVTTQEKLKEAYPDITFEVKAVD